MTINAIKVGDTVLDMEFEARIKCTVISVKKQEVIVRENCLIGGNQLTIKYKPEELKFLTKCI